ncbi:unnamed protein product [Clonostachys chloroleuca]|uniref:Uncharacterized protein n=1 Tax=Clonostachys chloroleuca TaxID=1926264 RepID=A0AA35LZF0_9HYPO|nr:unnamed protein product [Clonostachys chloroleuca]
MAKPSETLSQLLPNGLMLVVYLSRISALAAFIILIDLRGIIPRSIVYYSFGICFPSFAIANMGSLPVRTFREETEKPSLTSLSLTLFLNLFHLILAWVAFGLMLASHFWPTDTLTPNRIWFLYGQAYVWPTVMIGLLREYVTTQDKKKKKKALREAKEKALREAKEKALREAKEKVLREAEKQDSHEAEKPGEKDSIAEPVLGLCKSCSNL